MGSRVQELDRGGHAVAIFYEVTHVPSEKIETSGTSNSISIQALVSCLQAKAAVFSIAVSDAAPLVVLTAVEMKTRLRECN